VDRLSGSCLAVVLLAVGAGPIGATTRDRAADRYFRFEQGVWLNLHHFLYVVARAQIGAADADKRAVAGAPKDAARVDGVGPEARAPWDAALAVYRERLARKDLVFDDDMADVTFRLAAGKDSRTPPELPSGEEYLGPALDHVAPLYRDLWWPAHRHANAERIQEMRSLLARHGPGIARRLEAAYGFSWPAQPLRVDVCAYASGAGAYSRVRPSFIALSSLDAGGRGSQGLEMLFHEAMHQLEDPLVDEMNREAAAQGKRLPRNFTHALIFFTAGDAVRREIPGHTPYAEVNGLWAGEPFARLKALLVETWAPYLDGRWRRDEAVARLVARL
jgi:hypothetical protein